MALDVNPDVLEIDIFFPLCLVLGVWVASADASVCISPYTYSLLDSPSAGCCIGMCIPPAAHGCRIQPCPVAGMFVQLNHSGWFWWISLWKGNFYPQKKRGLCGVFSRVFERPVPELFCLVVLVPITESQLSCAQRDSDFHFNHPVLTWQPSSVLMADLSHSQVIMIPE